MLDELLKRMRDDYKGSKSSDEEHDIFLKYQEVLKSFNVIVKNHDLTTQQVMHFLLTTISTFGAHIYNQDEIYEMCSLIYATSLMYKAQLSKGDK